MSVLRTASIGLAVLFGTGAMAAGSVSATPLAASQITGQEVGTNPQIELVQSRSFDYDRRRHGSRKRERDRDHRFFFNGFWYAIPFWTTYGLATPFYGDRLSCGEARRLVDRRYNRVRTVECRGRTYTIRAFNNRGRAFTVTVDARTGDMWRSRQL